MPGFRRLLLIILLLPAAVPAQQASVVVANGTVTGHVTYAGSNLPVRNARITLEPVPQLDAPKPDSHGSTGTEGVHLIVETLPDGSFRFPNVKPGNYYVLADKLGCLSPISALTRDDLQHPTEQGLARMAQLLAGATVLRNKTADVTIQLHPGAIIAGTIRFDDGSAATDSRVLLMTRNPKGKWTAFRTSALGSYNGDVRTDDRGQYRISGLPAGEYLLRTPLEVIETKADFVFGGQGGSSTRDLFSLDVYQNEAFRPGDAKPIKLDEAEDSEGDDITIPIARMHTLSGSLAEQRSGHLINAGEVEIVYPDSDDTLATTTVSSEDGQFHFLYVPEGTYTLRVRSARDVTRVEIPYPRGTMPPSHTEEKTIKTYGEASQPLILNGDQAGVLLIVPPPTDPK